MRTDRPDSPGALQVHPPRVLEKPRYGRLTAIKFGGANAGYGSAIPGPSILSVNAMNLNRRHVLRAIAAAGAAGLVGPSVLAQGRARFVNPLRIPPLLEGRREGARRIFDLDIQSGTSEFFEGVRTPTLGINGAYLGPTVRCAAGDDVTLNVRNQLREPTTLHWHGLHVPAKYDGGPHQVIAAGGAWSPRFTIKQKAALCWYHSHLMGRTGEQVLRGLAGLFLIDDDEAKALALPSEYGVDDIPLVLQDRRIRSDGSFAYITSMHDTMMGYRGDVILVNGTSRPYLQVKRTRTRLRILNGSNARFYTLGRDDGRELVVIGSDGSLLDAPVRMRRLRLAPGERAEVLIDMEPDRTVVLMSYPDPIAGRGMGMGMMGGMGLDGDTFPILELRAGKLEAGPPVPERLISVPGWETAAADRTRIFELDMGMMGMMGRRMGMMGGGGMMMGRGGMGAMGINGRAMDPRRIDERVPLGSTEIWEIRNATPLAHPFHVHDVQFRVLDRDGAPPSPHERGLKDTVVVEPGGSVRVITKFTDYADPQSPYMYHCHILEHEDAGMMGQYVIV